MLPLQWKRNLKLLWKRLVELLGNKNSGVCMLDITVLDETPKINKRIKYIITIPMLMDQFIDIIIIITRS